MASHVRSSLQQVIDTLLWIQATDEEQLSVALSRLPWNERRNFLTRIQDAVYTESTPHIHRLPVRRLWKQLTLIARLFVKNLHHILRGAGLTCPRTFQCLNHQDLPLHYILISSKFLLLLLPTQCKSTTRPGRQMLDRSISLVIAMFRNLH